MLEALLWLLAAASSVLLASAGGRSWRRRRRREQPLPADWALTPRPVFSLDERRVYRQLREALPHHIVLSKLPLVRFCQPVDPDRTRYWFELLGTTHVTFAVCSTNGRVLAAIDLESGTLSPRALRIKQAVLAACRVRHLRCPPEQLPSIPELQLLVPQMVAARGPQPAPTALDARDSLAHALTSRRRERRPLWQDSGFLHDSFFGPDSRTGAPSDFDMLRNPPPAQPHSHARAPVHAEQQAPHAHQRSPLPPHGHTHAHTHAHPHTPLHAHARTPPHAAPSQRH